MVYQNRTLTEFIIRGIIHGVMLTSWYTVATLIYTALGSYLIVALALGGLIIWHTQKTISFLDDVFDIIRGH